MAFVSRQLGHASITTTLNVYTHLFDHAEHAPSVIGRLEDRFADLLRTTRERQVEEIEQLADGLFEAQTAATRSQE